RRPGDLRLPAQAPASEGVADLSGGERAEELATFVAAESPRLARAQVAVPVVGPEADAPLVVAGAAETAIPLADRGGGRHHLLIGRHGRGQLDVDVAPGVL